MARFLWICLGGAAGTGARYLLSGWVLRVAGPSFPWGTLAVNVLGSFLLGLLMQVAFTTDLLSPTARLALTTGVMGGFTTYSTFNLWGSPSPPASRLASSASSRGGSSRGTERKPSRPPSPASASFGFRSASFPSLRE